MNTGTTRRDAVGEDGTATSFTRFRPPSFSSSAGRAVTRIRAQRISELFPTAAALPEGATAFLDAAPRSSCCGPLPRLRVACSASSPRRRRHDGTTRRTPSPARSCTRCAVERWPRSARSRSAATTAPPMPHRSSSCSRMHTSSAPINHFLNRKMLADYARSKGVPAPDIAVTVSGLLILAGGLSILAGVQPKVGAGLISTFLLGVSPQMHAFWKEQDTQQRMHEMVNFTKNMALVGASLLAAGRPEPWPWHLRAPVQHND
jgi:putative oxidoreductase